MTIHKMAPMVRGVELASLRDAGLDDEDDAVGHDQTDPIRWILDDGDGWKRRLPAILVAAARCAPP